MNTRPLVYLDHNATTPCAREVVHAMLPFMSEEFGNAASGHAMGRNAARAVELARNQIAHAIGSRPDEVFFTSGATESNNLVLRGLADLRPGKTRIVSTAVEHPSIREPCCLLAAQGFDIADIPVTRDGVVDVDAADRLINANTLVVCIQGANNEVGTLQPVRTIADIAHKRGALVHCDATQLLGKVPVSLVDLDVDYAAFSAHKVYGPKGVGGLFVRSGVARSAIAGPYRGGSQERHLRPGTVNVAGIVGFGEALRLAESLVLEDCSRLRALRDAFEQAIKQAITDAKTNGSLADRLPSTSSLTIPGVPASMLLANTPDLCISDGSACSSGAIEPSRVLLAMGLTRENSEATVRVSFGRNNTISDVHQAVASIALAAKAVLTQLSA